MFGNQLTMELRADYSMITSEEKEIIHKEMDFENLPELVKMYITKLEENNHSLFIDNVVMHKKIQETEKV